jgi:hypothetical protein
MPDREELIQKTKDVCDRNVAIFDLGRSKVWHVIGKIIDWPIPVRACTVEKIATNSVFQNFRKTPMKVDHAQLCSMLNL